MYRTVPFYLPHTVFGIRICVDKMAWTVDWFQASRVTKPFQFLIFDIIIFICQKYAARPDWTSALQESAHETLSHLSYRCSQEGEKSKKFCEFVR